VELYFHSLNTPSWRGAWLSTGTNLPLPFTFKNLSEIVLKLSFFLQIKDHVFQPHKTTGKTVVLYLNP
jgi:hypothetical protein